MWERRAGRILLPMVATRPLPLLAALLLALLAVAPAADAAKRKPAKPKGCTSAQVSVTVGTTTTCVKRPDAARTIARETDRAIDQAARQVPRRHRKAFAAKARVAKRLRAAVARQTPGGVLSRAAVRARAAAAGSCDAAPTESTPATMEKDGFTMTGSGGGWIGTGMAGTTGVVTGTNGKGVEFSKEETDCVSWDTCPDADGVVKGTYRWAYKQGQTLRAEGHVVRLRQDFTARAELTAQVRDDGRVGTFDYVLDGSFEIGGDFRTEAGKVVKHLPTQRFIVRASRGGLDPRGDTIGGAKDAKFTARGPKGRRIDDAAMGGLVSLVMVAESELDHRGSKQLLDSEYHWYDAAKCLPVELSPEEPKVDPGQRVPVKVKIKDTTGAELSLPFKVDGGRTDITEGTSPATVTFTAPEERSKYPFSTFTVEHVSRRGRAMGYHSASNLEAEPKFAVSLSVSNRFTWEASSSLESNVGTDSECVSQSSGSGAHTWLLITAPGAGGTATVVNGVPVFAVGALGGKLDRSGRYVTTKNGKASYCQPAEQAQDASGCVASDVTDVNAMVDWKPDGTVQLDFSGGRTSDVDGGCPLHVPELGDPLSPELVSGSRGRVPVDQLRDPSVRTITITGTATDTGHEDCMTEDNGGCSDDPRTARIRYERDAKVTVDWVLTLTRLDA